MSPIVKPGVVHADHGWWFPEKDGEEPTLYEVWHSNVNDLIPHQYIGKLGFGAPYKCILCCVKPLAESYDTDMMEKFWTASESWCLDGGIRFLIDYEFCTGCQSCEVACKEEHDFPVGNGASAS